MSQRRLADQWHYSGNSRGIEILNFLAVLFLFPQSVFWRLGKMFIGKKNSQLLQF
jgi:hypothetical protein